MGHISTWFPEHNWDTRFHGEPESAKGMSLRTDWKMVLTVALVATIIFFAIMPAFPVPTY